MNEEIYDENEDKDTAFNVIKWGMIFSPLVGIFEALNLYLGPEKIIVDERFPSLFEEQHRFFGDYAPLLQCYVYWGVPALFATGIFFFFTKRKNHSYVLGTIIGIIIMLAAIMFVMP